MSVASVRSCASSRMMTPYRVRSGSAIASRSNIPSVQYLKSRHVVRFSSFLSIDFETKHILENGIAGCAVFKSDGVTDMLAKLDIHFLCYTLSNAHGSDSSWLRAGDLLPAARFHTPSKAIMCWSKFWVSKLTGEFELSFLNLFLRQGPFLSLKEVFP